MQAKRDRIAEIDKLVLEICEQIWALGPEPETHPAYATLWAKRRALRKEQSALKPSRPKLNFGMAVRRLRA